MKPGPAKPLKVYADTSVFGGVFDPEFQRHSMEFFREVHRGRVRLLVSVLVERELLRAPDEVKSAFEANRNNFLVLNSSSEAEKLRDAYLEHEVLSAKSLVDAWHIAIATVSECPVIVSWNFRHMVNLEKIPLYNAVNMLKGYGGIKIHAPPEVISGD